MWSRYAGAKTYCSDQRGLDALGQILPGRTPIRGASVLPSTTSPPRLKSARRRSRSPRSRGQPIHARLPPPLYLRAAPCAANISSKTASRSSVMGVLTSDQQLVDLLVPAPPGSQATNRRSPVFGLRRSVCRAAPSHAASICKRWGNTAACPPKRTRTAAPADPFAPAA